MDWGVRVGKIKCEVGGVVIDRVGLYRVLDRTARMARKIPGSVGTLAFDFAVRGDVEKKGLTEGELEVVINAGQPAEWNQYLACWQTVAKVASMFAQLRVGEMKSGEMIGPRYWDENLFYPRYVAERLAKEEAAAKRSPIKVLSQAGDQKVANLELQDSTWLTGSLGLMGVGLRVLAG